MRPSGESLPPQLGRAPPGGAADLAAEALSAFRAAGDQRGALRALAALARTLREAGHFEALSGCAQDYVALAHELGDDGAEAEALSCLATAGQAQGHYGAALEALRREAEVWVRLGDRAGQAGCLNTLGLLHASLGDYAEALGVLFQCQQLVTACDGIPPELHGACLLNIGHTYRAADQHEQALEFLLSGLAVAAAARDIPTELSARSQLGLVWRSQGQHARAVETLERGLELARAHGRRQDMLALAGTLGQALLDTGDEGAAREMFEQAHRLATELDDVQGQVKALLSLGRLAAPQGDSAGHLQAALALADEHDLRRLALDIHLALHDGLERQGDLAGAYRHHRASAQLERALLSEDSERRIRSLTTRFEAERARREAETYRQMNELAHTARLQAEETVRVRTAELEAAQIEVVTRLGMAAEYRDDRSGQHTRRVGELSAALAQALGLPPDQVDLLRWAARLHDIGKIGITDDVLLKQGTYTPEEFERMKLHTVIGAKVLEGSTSPLLQMAEEIVLTHHERWDGRGYPRGLAADVIPVSGRIVAVADVYDALTSERHHKPAWSVADALGEMQAQSGAQFDPAIVTCLVSLVQAGGPLPQAQPVRTPAEPETGEATPSSPAAQTVAGPDPELGALIQRAWDLRLSDPKVGEALARQGLERAQELGDPLLLGFAHRNVGRYKYQSSDFEAALSHLTTGLEVGLGLRNLQLQADCANFMAAVYNALTDFGKATEQLSLVLRIAREQQDRQREAHCLHNLGMVSKDSRELEQAHSYLTESIATYRAIGDQQGEIRALGTYADVTLARGELDLAARLATESSERAREVGDAYLEAVGDSVAGKAYTQLGQCERALPHQLRALAYAEAADNRQVRAWALLDLGPVYRHLGRMAEARAALESALAEAQALSLKDVEMGAYRQLSEISHAEGRLAEALDFYQRHHAVELEIFNQEAALKTRALMVQMEVERAESEARLYKLRSIELASANAALERVNAEKSGLVSMLEEQSRLLERQLSEDGLTGLYNRKHIEGLLQREFLRHRQSGQPLCVAMVDIDHFKAINDRFSHLTGDRVLKTVARLFQQACRPTDAIGRYGGEEFLFVFPATSPEHGRRVCERIQAAMHGFDWGQLHPHLRVTLSMGVAADLDLSNHERLISRADAKLYEAKHSGRDRICT